MSAMRLSAMRLTWIPVGLLAFATGCAMCANPYDQCGPLADTTCGDACQPGFRAGSILSAPVGLSVVGPPVEGELVEPEPSAVPSPARPAPAVPGGPPPNEDVSKFFPGVPRDSILSVTDRKVEADSGESGKSTTKAEPQPQPLQQRPRIHAQPSSSSGWSVRGPRVSRSE